MKTLNPDHPIRKTLKHLALASAMGAALYFGASPAQAQITEITPIGTTTDKIHWTNVGGTGSAPVEGARVAGNLVNNSGMSIGGGGQWVSTGNLDSTYSNITQQTGGLIIDLGATYELSLMQIWNFNPTNFPGGVTFGPETFDFKFATDPAAVTTAGGKLNVANLSLFTSLTDNTALALAPVTTTYLGETYTFGSPTVPAEIGDHSGGIQSLSGTTISARYIFLDDLDGSNQFTTGRLGFSELKFYGVLATSLTVTLTSPSNNQAYPAGESVSATAEVDFGTAPYTVEYFLDSGSGFESQGTATEAPYTLDLGVLSEGSYQIYATVTDSAGSPATDTSAPRTFSVAPPTATTTSVVSSGSPSTYGDSVTFTATVDPVPTGGTVQFYNGFDPLGGPVAVNTTTGVASVTTSTLGVVGPNEITAEYSGNPIFETSTSDPITQVVNPAPLTVAAQNVIRPPNTPNPALPFQITGFKNGESLGNGVTGTPALSTTAILASPIGDYPITCAVGTLDADNYSFVTFVNATLTVSNLIAIPLGTTADKINWTNVGGGISPQPTTEPARDTDNLVDNSGIGTNVNGKLVHNGTDNGAMSNITQQTGGLIIDLGATYELSLMQIWNFNPSVTSQFVTFGSDKFDFKYATNPAAVTTTGGNLSVANLSLFTSLTDDTPLALAPGAVGYLGETYTLGSHIAPAEIGDQSGASQSLSGTTITARYIFLDDLDGAPDFGGRLGFSELKFYGSPVATTGGFDAWASANGATGQTPQQDHDFDGVSNGIEFFMGETGSSFTATPGLNASNMISWPASAGYVGTYEVQTSPNLATWTNVNPRPVPSGGFLTYTLPPGAPGGKSFVRLLVTPTP